MLDTKTLLLSLSASLVASFWIFRAIQRKHKQLRYPPGPKRLPLIGNLFQLMEPFLWERAVEWGKEYGGLIYLESLGHRLLIINSYECAKELLSRRSAIYSSRPHLTMTMDLEGWGYLTTFTPYGDVFRQHRSYQQHFIDSPETLGYLDVQLSKTHAMIKAILDDPEDYASHVLSLPGAVILMNVYGHQVGKNDRYVDIGRQGSITAAEAEEYLFLDIVPWLKHLPEWFPWVKFHRVAREVRRISYAMRNELYQLAKENFASGTLRHCMTSIFLSENTCKDKHIVDEDIFTAAAATLYIGGVDTSATGIMTFIMQMLKHPEVQRRAQSEIEEVVGSERLPTFSDMQDLPYVRGVCAEVLRVAVIIAMVPPHLTTEDDLFEGYHIPAGTTVLANTWAMSFNPEYFPEPLEFKPERWLPGPDGKEVPEPRPEDFSFGFGRRVCPGQDWAQNLIFIAVSSMLAVFNIEKAIGEDGDEIAPSDTYTPGFLRHLGPSQCKFTPRSQKLVSLLHE